MDWDDYEAGGSEEIQDHPRDPKIDQAKKRVRALLDENDRSVFYIKQLQVLLEGDFFHWITGRAVGELVLEGSVGYEDAALAKGKARFVFNRAHRYRIRQISRAVQVIERYSSSEMARACGHWAENLFLVALAEHGFMVHERNTNTWRGRAWTQSKHNLDFIVSRDGVTYGSEVKNTWDYIPPEEMRLKMTMCQWLGIRPLFIWRFAPKNYMYEIIQGGGYGLIFKAHIFPLGHGGLVQEIREALGLECDAPSRIPDGLLQRFEKWHRRVAGL